jgi:DNA-binding NarL/FixJ family response regulator
LVGKRGDPIVSYWLSNGYLAEGDHERANATSLAGLKEARRRDDHRAVGLLAGHLFHAELSRLRVEDAHRYLDLMEQTHDPTDATSLIYRLVSRAWLHGYVGEWQSVVDMCRDWSAKVRLIGRYQLATARFIEAEARLAFGDVAQAWEEMTDAVAGLAQMQAIGQLHISRAAQHLGMEHEAMATFQAALKEVGPSPRSITRATELALTASTLDVPEIWRSCYERLEPERLKLVLVYAPISVQRVLGRLATAMKLWPAATEHFAKAARSLEKGGARWELAQTYLDHAAMHTARGRRGDVRKSEALRSRSAIILRSMGLDGIASMDAPLRESSQFALTTRELEVLSLVAEGRRNNEIAESLTLSHRTVERHLENIYSKMQVGTRTEAVVKAAQSGLVGNAAKLPQLL